jgi:hypothetical protein
MKKVVLLITAFIFAITANAQGLSLLRKYGANWGNEIVTCKNKPNGYIYRLREDIQANDLPWTAGDGYELYIAEPINIGWLAMYRLPTSSDKYSFIVSLYNEKKEFISGHDLCNIANNHYCEVQDVRWDDSNGYLLFNMACPSYASSINGKGSKLYCYDVNNGYIVWQTDYLVSNDIFILNDDYVFCSYGFTNEKDYLYMLDKKTGKMYSKILMPKKVHYMEIQYRNNMEVLYVVDYDDNLYTYAIHDRGIYNAPKSTTSQGAKYRPHGMRK